MVSQDGRYELSKCVDTSHDYDGGTWYHVWDNVNSTIVYEDDSFQTTKELFETLVNDTLIELKRHLEEAEGDLEVEIDINGANSPMAKAMRLNIANIKREL